MIKIIAFDMWQTLGTYKFNLYKEVLKIAGLKMSLDEFTLKKGEIEVEKELDDKERFVKKIKLMGVSDEQTLQKVRELYDDAHNSIFLYGDSLDTLTELKKGGKILVLITNVDSYAHNKIIRLFPKGLFNCILASYEVGLRKPNKEFFLKLTEKFSARPNEILMVGDSIEMDIKPAKSLGWKTALIKRTNEDSQKNEYVDYYLTNLRQVLEIK